jgi:hypothetical protein
MALNATSQSTPYVTPLFFKENIRGTRMSLFIERMMTNDDVTPVCIKEELQFSGGKTSRSKYCNIADKAKTGHYTGLMCLIY